MTAQRLGGRRNRHERVRARRARDALDLDPGRIHVVPLAIDHGVYRPGPEEREPILLYPARGWPHKNHARLFKAFEMLRETRPQLRLILTGGGLERLDPLPEGVESLGEVPASQLASLYRRAACLVYPSLYEGFGIPPLEAMACGCPVAASTAGAIPEVCGDAAVLFEPTDVDAIATAMLEVDDRRDDLRERGLARAALFTWDETARRHEDVYRAAASATPAGSHDSESARSPERNERVDRAPDGAAATVEEKSDRQVSDRGQCRHDGSGSRDPAQAGVQSAEHAGNANTTPVESARATAGRRARS